MQVQQLYRALPQKMQQQYRTLAEKIKREYSQLIAKIKLQAPCCKNKVPAFLLESLCLLQQMPG